MSSIQTWQVTSNRPVQIELPHCASLDAVTRHLPDGYYSTFRTYGNGTRVIGLKSHLQRLFQPVQSPDANEGKLREQLGIFLQAYPNEARVRVIMTKQGQLYVSIEPLKKPAPQVYEHGVRVETTELERNSPRLKSTAFITASEDRRRHIAQAGIFEALLVKNGKILEGMTSNFFYIKNDILHTAQRDILLGVTRRAVIRAARGIGLGVEYRPLKRDQLEIAREAFITSSSRGIVPVIQIDRVRVGEGRVGAITRQLSAAYEAYVLEKAETICP